MIKRASFVSIEVESLDDVSDDYDPKLRKNEKDSTPRN
tara:strand:+ start:291 stop:404 length:114 start_codon:yes stop_codon:yes gene_type:complete